MSDLNRSTEQLLSEVKSLKYEIALLKKFLKCPVLKLTEPVADTNLWKCVRIIIMTLY